MGNCVPKKVPNRMVVDNPIHDDEVPSIDHTKGKKQTHSALKKKEKRKKKQKDDDRHHVVHFDLRDHEKSETLVAPEHHPVDNGDEIIKEKLRALENEDNERRLKIEQLMNELDRTRKMVVDYQQEQLRLKETIVELEETAQRASQTSIESFQEENQEVNTADNLKDLRDEVEAVYVDDGADNVSVITNTNDERSQVEFLDSTLNRVTTELAASQMLISQYESERQQFMQELSRYQDDVKAITDNLQSDLKMMTLRAEVAERQLHSSQRT